MKKSFQTVGIFSLLAMTLLNCSPPNPLPSPAPCVTTGTAFQNLYASTLASNTAYSNQVTMDLITHEYTFTLSSTKTVCAIGYQGNANLFAAAVPYTIEIVDNSSSSTTPIYSGNHIFNASFTDYVLPTSTIVLNAGTSYTIRRKAPNFLGNIGNTVGRLCKFSSPSAPTVVPYPVTSGIMTITGSNFYGIGLSAINFGIPFIDLTFQ